MPEFKPYTEEIVDAFKERYSDHGITEFPDSKGIPYKYFFSDWCRFDFGEGPCCLEGLERRWVALHGF